MTTNPVLMEAHAALVALPPDGGREAFTLGLAAASHSEKAREVVFKAMAELNCRSEDLVYRAASCPNKYPNDLHDAVTLAHAARVLLTCYNELPPRSKRLADLIADPRGPRYAHNRTQHD